MEQVQRSRAKAAQIEPLLTKFQAMGQPQSPTNPEGYPKMGWEPKFEHITGPGSAIKDVLKGLLYGVSLLAPVSQSSAASTLLVKI